MTSSPSRSSSSQVNRWRYWIRPCGNDWLVTNDSANCPDDRPVEGWSGRPGRSRRLFSPCWFACAAHPRIDDFTCWVRRDCCVCSHTFLLVEGESLSPVSTSSKNLATALFALGMVVRLLKLEIRSQHERPARSEMLTVSNDPWASLVDEPMARPTGLTAPKSRSVPPLP